MPAPVAEAEPVSRIAVRNLGAEQAQTRYAAMQAIVAAAPENAVLIATTGKTGRELFTIGDTERKPLCSGLDGVCVCPGARLALNTTRPVILLDGDGAALMKLGNFATIGRQRPPNLVHVLLDNGVHDSTVVSRQSPDRSISRLSPPPVAMRTACRLAGLMTSRLASRPPAAARGHISSARISHPVQSGILAGRTRPPPEVIRRLKAFVGRKAAGCRCGAASPLAPNEKAGQQSRRPAP